MGLPADKKEKLIEKVAEGVERELVERNRELREREVEFKDRIDVLDKGLQRGADRAGRKISEDKGKKR